MSEALPEPQDAEIVQFPSVPGFEGEPVVAVRVKITGLSQVAPETGELPAFGIDDRVRLVGEFRCTAVRHYVDQKTGEILREQILAPISVSPCPFDPNDPSDDGVIRKARGKK